MPTYQPPPRHKRECADCVYLDEKLEPQPDRVWEPRHWCPILERAVLTGGTCDGHTERT